MISELRRSKGSFMLLCCTVNILFGLPIHLSCADWHHFIMDCARSHLSFASAYCLTIMITYCLFAVYATLLSFQIYISHRVLYSIVLSWVSILLFLGIVFVMIIMFYSEVY